MNAKLLIALLAALALSLGVAAPAEAGMVSGWDFSQWFGPGQLTTDGATGSNTLDANYSDFDPTQGAGAESAAFGTMYMDGSFGSTNVNPLNPAAEFVPTGGSLASNLNPGMGAVPFDTHTVLDAEGQVFSNFLSMTAQSAASIVFEADLSSISGVATDWVLDLAGQTFAGTANVGVEFSTDGTSFTGLGDIMLNTLDTAFNVNLGAGPAAAAYVRLNFDAPQAGGVNQAIIDNLSISAVVPEPTGLTLLGLGLMGLAMAGRKRA